MVARSSQSRPGEQISTELEFVRIFNDLTQTSAVQVREPSEEQIQKYSIKNIEYYGDYVLEIFNLPWYRVKYLDKSHFQASGEKIEF